MHDGYLSQLYFRTVGCDQLYLEFFTVDSLHMHRLFKSNNPLIIIIFYMR